jgi:hypothetical protein
MCRPHWAHVSYGTKRRVYALLDTEGPLGVGYTQAVKDAVAEVVARSAR